MMAGKKFAAAVPLVQTRATGWSFCFARPSAKKPADRSSNTGIASMPAWAASAITSGVDREPGETTAWRTPQRARVSTSTLAQRQFRLRASGGETFDMPAPGSILLRRRRQTGHRILHERRNLLRRQRTAMLHRETRHQRPLLAFGYPPFPIRRVPRFARHLQIGHHGGARIRFVADPTGRLVQRLPGLAHGRHR